MFNLILLKREFNIILHYFYINRIHGKNLLSQNFAINAITKQILVIIWIAKQFIVDADLICYMQQQRRCHCDSKIFFPCTQFIQMSILKSIFCILHSPRNIVGKS